jgi:hydroxymethylbilane synthase
LASHAGAAKVTAAPESKTAADASTSVKRGFPRQATLSDFPSGATIATSSTRRQAQLLAIRPDLRLVPIRGNVGTRLQKLAERAEIDALVLAAAGLRRLNFPIGKDGSIQGDGVPAGLIAVYLEIDQMIPCVGQAALGIETRANDPAIDAITARLNDPVTFQCVTGERAFLRTMGGGCLSPVACYGEMVEDKLRLRAISFRTETMRRGEIRGNPAEAADLGATLAAELK